jgi:hypothetical protein
MLSYIVQIDKQEAKLMSESNPQTVMFGDVEYERDAVRTTKLEFQGITYIVESVHRKDATETAYDKVKRLIMQNMNNPEFG